MTQPTKAQIKTWIFAFLQNRADDETKTTVERGGTFSDSYLAKEAHAHFGYCVRLAPAIEDLVNARVVEEIPVASVNRRGDQEVIRAYRYHHNPSIPSIREILEA